MTLMKFDIVNNVESPTLATITQSLEQPILNEDEQQIYNEDGSPVFSDPVEK